MGVLVCVCVHEQQGYVGGKGEGGVRVVIFMSVNMCLGVYLYPHVCVFVGVCVCARVGVCVFMRACVCAYTCLSMCILLFPIRYSRSHRADILL